MDSRAQAASRRLVAVEMRFALRSFTCAAFLSSASRIASRGARALLPKIDQDSGTEKPHPGDFLRADLKFTRTSESG